MADILRFYEEFLKFIDFYALNRYNSERKSEKTTLKESSLFSLLGGETCNNILSLNTI